MPQYEYDLICIGSGPAGEKAATQAAWYGKRVAVVERAYRPGGAMVNTGTLPSKSLRETALVCSILRRRALPGISFDLDRSLSVPRFMARRLLIEQQEHDRIENSFDRRGITAVQGYGRLLDAHTVEVCPKHGEVQRLTTENVLIATGSSPLRPEHIPFTPQVIVDADTVLEIQTLPQSIIIVGGGVIGCEYASIFAEIGVEVTLVHPRDAVLPFVDRDAAAQLTDAMRKNGVNFHLNCSVKSAMVAADNRAHVELADGDTLTGDVMLWAAGRTSNTAGIGLEELGVHMSDRGAIRVSDTYQTNVASIYAAGDVIGFPALAATSMEQGRIAACAMFGFDFKQALAETMPMGLYTIPAVSMVGMIEAEAQEDEIDTVIGIARYRDNARGRMLGDDQGLIKCVFDRRTQRLLGATIVGEDATELIHVAQFTIVHEGGINDFINACFNYPSLSETLQVCRV